MQVPNPQGFLGVSSGMLPQKNFEIWDSQIVENALNLSILPSVITPRVLWDKKDRNDHRKS